MQRYVKRIDSAGDTFNKTTWFSDFVTAALLLALTVPACGMDQTAPPLPSVVPPMVSMGGDNQAANIPEYFPCENNVQNCYQIRGGTMAQQKTLARQLRDKITRAINSTSSENLTSCCNQQYWVDMSSFPAPGVRTRVHYRMNDNCTVNLYQSFFISTGMNIMVESSTIEEVISSDTTLTENQFVVEEHYRGWCGGDALPTNFYYPNPYLDQSSATVSSFISTASYYDYACNPYTSMQVFAIFERIPIPILGSQCPPATAPGILHSNGPLYPADYAATTR